jgi:hypothetical protein
MEQRAVVRFLTIQKLFAKGIRAELDGVYGHEVICLSAVKKWRKRLAIGRITLEDDPRSGRPPNNDLSESVCALIKENPLISCKGMCQEFRLAKTTCPRVLHEDLGFRRCYFRWVPHVVTENEAQSRTAFGEDFLQFVRHARETNFDNILTGDESWFDFWYSSDSAWGYREIPFRLEHQRKVRAKNAWRPKSGRRLVSSLLALLARVRYNTEFCCTSGLRDIKRSLCDGKLRKAL